MEFNFGRIKTFRIILMIAISVGFLCLIYYNIENNIRLKEYEIIGIVQKVDYNEKGQPYSNVNGITYYLDGSCNFNHNIEVGDSIIKRQNSFVLKLIKKNTGEIFTYKL